VLHGCGTVVGDRAPSYVDWRACGWGTRLLRRDVDAQGAIGAVDDEVAAGVKEAGGGDAGMVRAGVEAGEARDEAVVAEPARNW
jgi:hypothetical protein